MTDYNKEITPCSWCLEEVSCHMSPTQEIIQEHEVGIEFQSAICDKCIKRLYEE